MKQLTVEQVRFYQGQGYLSPLRAFDSVQAQRYRALLEGGERAHRLELDQRRKMYLYLKWVDDIVRDPRILDAVEDLIGPDILVYHLTLWIKEPHTDAFVSWHQDSTYFGLSPADHITAWVALSPSSTDSGCVQVVPGSHHRGQVPHDQLKRVDNLFAAGQTIAVDDTEAVDLLLLQPGEFSLHHTHLFHHSMPNRSNDRRIGLGISYIPTRCRCSARQRLSATLVRGEDRYGHFDLDPAPRTDFDPIAVEVHQQAMARWHAARAELIPKSVNA